MSQHVPGFSNGTPDSLGAAAQQAQQAQQAQYAQQAQQASFPGVTPGSPYPSHYGQQPPQAPAQPYYAPQGAQTPQVNQPSYAAHVPQAPQGYYAAEQSYAGQTQVPPSSINYNPAAIPGQMPHAPQPMQGMPSLYPGAQPYAGQTQVPPSSINPAPIPGQMPQTTQSPRKKRRRGLKIGLATALVLVLIIAGITATTLFTGASYAGAATPQKLQQDLETAVKNQDIATLMSMNSPAENQLIHTSQAATNTTLNQKYGATSSLTWSKSTQA